MKSITRALALVGAGALTLAACGTAPEETDGGGGSDAGGASSDYKACMVSDSGGWDDKSFNESSYNGLLAAEEDLGIEKASAESTAVSDFAPNINNMVTQQGSFTGDFEDQSKGKAVSDEFYNAGADIVMPVAGPVGAGTLASAKEADDRMVIWVDADGFETNSSDEDAQAVILTSVMKEMSTAVEDVISGAADGQFDGTPYVGTLENGGVGLAPFHEFEDDVPAELTEELESLKQEIIDGSVVVESAAAPAEA